MQFELRKIYINKLGPFLEPEFFHYSERKYLFCGRLKFILYLIKTEICGNKK